MRWQLRDPQLSWSAADRCLFQLQAASLSATLGNLRPALWRGIFRLTLRPGSGGGRPSPFPCAPGSGGGPPPVPLRTGVGWASPPIPCAPGVRGFLGGATSDPLRTGVGWRSTFRSPAHRGRVAVHPGSLRRDRAAARPSARAALERARFCPQRLRSRYHPWLLYGLPRLRRRQSDGFLSEVARGLRR